MEAERRRAARVGLRQVLADTYRSLTLGGMAGVTLVVAGVLGVAGQLVSVSARETILTEGTRNVRELTSREADLRDATFRQIADLARMLERDQEAILARPALHPAPRGDITLKVAPNGSAYKVEKNGGASLFLPARSPLTPARAAFAQATESFDPFMESVLATMPDTIVAVYFNGTDSLNRYVPFIDDVASQFDPQLDSTQFNFYYVADAAHDPAGEPRWTEAYLDPAGKGWMVTCAVPVHKDGEIVGVTGIDVTIDQLVKRVVALPLPYEGVAMLTSADGQILAMAPALEPVLGLKELSTHDYGGAAVQAETLKPDAFRISKSANPDVRKLFADAMTQGHEGTPTEVRLGGHDWIVTHGALEETGWRLFVFTPKDVLLAPLLSLQDRALQLATVVGTAVLAAAAVVTYLVLRRSQRLADTIAAPLVRLSAETGALGTDFSPRALTPVGIDEIDTLSANFARMSVELAQRQQAVIEASVAASVQRRSQELLRRVLPASIVDRLMRGEQVIADRFDGVTVIFADIVGFTPLAATLSPTEVVRMLDQVFVAFDEVAARFGIEKIKTIGDAYMVVAGAPIPCEDHAVRAAHAALAMVKELERLDLAHKVVMRVGLHSGPAVGGVIGKDKFLYDLWGDTVNTASRLESHGLGGRVQVTDETRALLAGSFLFEERGVVDLKGKGPTHTWWLVGAREPWVEVPRTHPTDLGPSELLQ